MSVGSPDAGSYLQQNQQSAANVLLTSPPLFPPFTSIPVPAASPDAGRDPPLPWAASRVAVMGLALPQDAARVATGNGAGRSAAVHASMPTRADGILVAV